MALSKEVLLRRLFRHLAKRSDDGFYGNVTVDFRDGYPIMSRTVQQRKLEHADEVDGVTEERLTAILGV